MATEPTLEVIENAAEEYHRVAAEQLKLSAMIFVTSRLPCADPETLRLWREDLATLHAWRRHLAEIVLGPEGLAESDATAPEMTDDELADLYAEALDAPPALMRELARRR